MSGMARSLIVLWSLPTHELTKGTDILSFLSPSEEAKMRKPVDSTVWIARQEMPAVRAEAQNIYREIVGEMGTVTVSKGRTLRQLLQRRLDEASRWWFMDHHEGEIVSTYDDLLSVLLVLRIKKLCDAQSVRLVGAPGAISACLKSLDVPGQRRGEAMVAPAIAAVVRGIAARVRYFFRFVLLKSRLPKPPAFDDVRTDAAMFGSWPWSFVGQGVTIPAHRYLGDLPTALQAEGLNNLRWFVWVGGTRPPTPDECASLARTAAVTLLQAHVGLLDAIWCLVDVRPAWWLWRARKTPQWRQVFVRHDVDLQPLFSEQVQSRACSSLIPHLELVALATKRACVAHRPRLAFEFQELFPLACAHYDGIRRAQSATRVCAVMHSSYCHETVIAMADPVRDLGGKPDNCPMPQPDSLYAIGELAKRVFVDAGLAAHRVVVTGVPRYSYLFRAKPIAHTHRVAEGGLRLLLLASLAEEVEVDMVEAAALACNGITRPRLRPHPLGRLLQHERVAAVRHCVDVSSEALDGDLAWANVILFSYSTAADEAFVLGKTVWQWLPDRFNGSALAEVGGIRTFGTIEELRRAFQAFGDRPSAVDADRSATIRELFGPADGREAQRIAQHALTLP